MLPVPVISLGTTLPYMIANNITLPSNGNENPAMKRIVYLTLTMVFFELTYSSEA